MIFRRFKTTDELTVLVNEKVLTSSSSAVTYLMQWEQCRVGAGHV